MGAEVVGGDGGEHEAALGGESSGAQAQQRLGGPGQPAKTHLPLVDDQAMRRLFVDRPAFPPDEGQDASLGDDRLSSRAGGDVDRMTDATRREADLPPQVVGFGEPQELSDVVDLGDEQAIQGAA